MDFKAVRAQLADICFAFIVKNGCAIWGDEGHGKFIATEELHCTFNDILNEYNQDRSRTDDCILFLCDEDKLHKKKAFRFFRLVPSRPGGRPLPRFVTWPNKLNFLFADNPHFALVSAYRANLNIKEVVQEFCVMHNTLRANATIKYDREYNNIVGVHTDSDEETIHFEYPSEFTETTIDTILLHEFGCLLKKLFYNKSTNVDHLAQMGGARIMSDVISPKIGNGYLLADFYKRDRTPEEHMELHKWHVAPYVTCMPKPGVLTSSGKTRTVFAATTSLEAYTRFLFRHVDFTTLPGYVKNSSGINPSFKYSYDIISCDKLVAQYWYAFLESEYPHLLDILYPKMWSPNGLYRPDKMPSGMVYTSIVTNTFTCAYMQHHGITGQFQGDGILSEDPLPHLEHLRRGPDYVLNGFTSTEFVNTHKLVKCAYIRGDRYLSGRDRYFVRYWVYKNILKARGIERYPKPTWLYKGRYDIDLVTPAQLVNSIQSSGKVLPQALANHERSNCESTVFSRRHKICVNTNVAFPMLSSGTMFIPVSPSPKL